MGYWWVIHDSEVADMWTSDRRILFSRKTQFQWDTHHAELALDFEGSAGSQVGWASICCHQPPIEGLLASFPGEGSCKGPRAMLGAHVQPFSGTFSSWCLCASAGQHLWWNGGQVVEEEGRMGEGGEVGAGKDPATAKWVQKLLSFWWYVHPKNLPLSLVSTWERQPWIH